MKDQYFFADKNFLLNCWEFTNWDEPNNGLFMEVPMNPFYLYLKSFIPENDLGFWFKIFDCLSGLLHKFISPKFESVAYSPISFLLIGMLEEDFTLLPSWSSLLIFWPFFNDSERE